MATTIIKLNKEEIETALVNTIKAKYPGVKVSKVSIEGSIDDSNGETNDNVEITISATIELSSSEWLNSVVKVTTIDDIRVKPAGSDGSRITSG